MVVWRDDQVELSWRVLGTLRELADFVVIGGWGVYFWTRKLKSRDIDIYIDQDNFYGLQGGLLGRDHVVKRNPRLRKLEAIIEGVEVDIYTPFLCNLVVPCKDVLGEGWSSDIEGFRVAVPEVLLLLKAQAARERWHAEKGMKDRADLISLVAFADLKFDLLRELLKKYDADGSLVEVIERTLRESRAEYGFLDLTYERDGVGLRKLVARELG
ncbi:MAG: hypothetical protein U9M97_01590 [Candidatus Hadarchaeota archaeon]|nr:hypothetical protein [Candidatus Hadarchaeota archaeon]